MATFYLRTRSGLACKKAGTNHSAYIAGVGRYSNKHEVIAVIDKNLPQWAIDGRDFFQKADLNERANGRSYRSLVFAIPLEATNTTKWAEDLTAKILGDRHAYRMAIHEDKNNPHCHLMFTERGRKDDLSPDKYFGRSNAKDRRISQKTWLVQAKKTYLEQIRTVAPSYTPKFTHEPKIGPKMNKAGNVYEAERDKRLKEVEYLRLAARAVCAIDATIERLELEAQERAAGVFSTLTYTPRIPSIGVPATSILASLSQAECGRDTALNVSGFVPSRVIMPKPSVSRTRRLN